MNKNYFYYWFLQKKWIYVPRFYVLIFEFSEDWDTAMRRSRRSEYTSNLTSDKEISNMQKNKRKRKMNPRLLPNYYASHQTTCE